MIAQTIQLALAPVFVMVAIGNLLYTLSSRLGRVVDRARQLQVQRVAIAGPEHKPEHKEVVAELRLLDRRMHLITWAILLLVSSSMAIGATVAVLFLEDLAGLQLRHLVAATFLLAIALMIWALLLFFREVRIAARHIKVPHEHLELERSP